MGPRRSETALPLLGNFQLWNLIKKAQSFDFAKEQALVVIAQTSFGPTYDIPAKLGRLVPELCFRQDQSEREYCYKTAYERRSLFGSDPNRNSHLSSSVIWTTYAHGTQGCR